VNIEQVVERVEWDGVGAPIRFEPAMYQRWLRVTNEEQKAVLALIAKHNACGEATALALACTSWGCWQFLGETLYSETSFAGTLVDFLNSKNSQQQAFLEWLGRHHFDEDSVLGDAVELRRFAIEWNGPAEVDAYVAKLYKAAGIDANAKQS
jgi:hypothetical protein